MKPPSTEYTSLLINKIQSREILRQMGGLCCGPEATFTPIEEEDGDDAELVAPDFSETNEIIDRIKDTVSDTVPRSAHTMETPKSGTNSRFL